jgi:UDPglucose 6-dehydrogenase
MKIGIIGLGVVGSAIRYGFEKLGHDVVFHDIALGTKIQDVLESEICFLCVPSPSEPDGRCDTSIVERVIANLALEEYKGIICIKSTVVPGTTEKLKEKYSNKKICFVPEFLRERCASLDFVENHDVCIIGCDSEEHYKLIKEVHGHLPRKFKKLTTTEAELSKYFNNVYNATLITFANSFYEVCKSSGANYTKVKNAIVLREHIQDIYLDCNKNFRGFGGMCLPKDTKALASLCKEKGLNVEFFDNILEENSKYKITVFKGMRKK